MGSTIYPCEYGVGSGFLSLTIPNHVDFVQGVGVQLSMLPICAMIVCALGFIFTRRLSVLFAFVLGTTGSAINEWVLKPITFQQRPIGACISSNGFPSGHSVNGMAVCLFLVFTELINYRASIKRRIFLITSYFAIFGLTGPARWWVRDHNWEQIGVGVGAGAIWGIAIWILTRFIFQRYFLKRMMQRPIVKKLKIKNDLDPEFRRTKSSINAINRDDEDDHLLRSPSQTFIQTSRKKVIWIHVIVALIDLLLAGIGAVASYWKVKQVNDENCDIAAPGILISLVAYTAALALLQLAIAYLVALRYKFQEHVFNDPLWMKITWFVFGYIFVNAAFYVYLSFLTIGNCDKVDVPYMMIYAIVWAGLQFILSVMGLFVFFKLNFQEVYSDDAIWSHQPVRNYNP